MLEALVGAFDVNKAADLLISEEPEYLALGMRNDGVQAVGYEGLEEAQQMEGMADFLNGMDKIKYENWEKISLDERLEALQEIENEAAKLGARVPLQVMVADFGSPNLAGSTYGQMDWGNRRILINKYLLEQDGMSALGNCMDTVLHEGRHAYQWSNLYVKRTEPNDERYNAWNMNLQTGYLSYERFGFQRYYMQPVEVDARIYAEGIRSKISYR